MSLFDTKNLSSRDRKTLHTVFEHPARADVRWKQVENLLLALGGELSDGRGSRIRVRLGDVRAVFHRPHALKVTGKEALRSIRRLLLEAGVDPTEESSA